MNSLSERRLEPHPLDCRAPLRESKSGPRRQRGFTLIELLVVITIIAMVTSAAIPIMSAASDARRTREGARLLSEFFGNAQTRAIASGRSVAVIIQPLKNNGNAATDLYLAEVPPPYIGDTLSSYAIKGTSGNTISFSNDCTVPNQGIRPGDLIRFGYRGQLYYLDPTNPNAYIASNSNVPIVTTDNSPNATTAPLLSPNGTPFQVFRQPAKTFDTPGQMLDGAAIDLNFSGIDSNAVGYVAGGPGPITVTFSATGSLDMVYAGGKVVRPLTGISFLIGKVENIPQGAAPTTPNWQDGNSQWVFVSRQTGLSTTAPVRATATSPVASRYLAQTGQSQGGN